MAQVANVSPWVLLTVMVNLPLVRNATGCGSSGAYGREEHVWRRGDGGQGGSPLCSVGLDVSVSGNVEAEPVVSFCGLVGGDCEPN